LLATGLQWLRWVPLIFDRGSGAKLNLWKLGGTFARNAFSGIAVTRLFLQLLIPNRPELIHAPSEASLSGAAISGISHNRIPMLQLGGDNGAPSPEHKLKAVFEDCTVEDTGFLEPVNLPNLATGIVKCLCAFVRVSDLEFDAGREVVPCISLLSILMTSASRSF
jgi:hypothetical protein